VQNWAFWAVTGGVTAIGYCCRPGIAGPPGHGPERRLHAAPPRQHPAQDRPREALLAPLAPGSTVISLSSGAALCGSPLSGGYAGA
jgi:hypothetical protein